MVRSARDATIFCGSPAAAGECRWTWARCGGGDHDSIRPARRQRRRAAAVTARGGGAGGARQRLRRELARLGAPRAAVTVEAVSPMLAEARERPFTAAGWLFELKYDGYRVLAGRAAAGAVRLLYRSGRDATALFPELARAVA